MLTKNSKSLSIFIVCSLILSFIIMSQFIGSKTIQEKELTNKQINAMIELGVINVYTNLPHNYNDRPIELSYILEQGTCNIYQDIFGRYYCRW